MLDALVLPDVVVNGRAADVLHHEVVVLTRLTHVVRADDVGVIELSGGATFLVEAADELLVVRELLGQDLHRDMPIEAELLGKEHGCHRSRAELLQDLVSGDVPARPPRLELLAESIELMSGEEVAGDEQLGQGLGHL